MKYAKVIVNISHENLDKTYEYSIPEEWEPYAVLGAQVLIPFGVGNRQREGFILELTDTPEYAPEKIKPILQVKTNATVLESHFIQLAGWIREQYGATLNDALRAVLPVKASVKEQEKKYIHLAVDRSKLFTYMEECERKNYKARLRLAQMLEDQDMISYQEAIKEYKVSKDAIKKFQELGIIYISSQRTYRNPVKEHICQAYDLVLTKEQKYIVDEIWKEYEQGMRNTYLLHGVTGSGKTEVYMELIHQVLEKGKQVIFLIPEIALTVPMVERFYQRFGNRVSVLHSKLSQGERYDQYTRAKNGEISIMIGPRSALFTPFENLGMIIIDEEHETGFKSDTAPKYHAREVALQRAKMCDSMVVMGSATPSMESYHKAKEGKYRLFSLTERIHGGGLPVVSVVDLREELRQRNTSVFSRELKNKMLECLEQKKQILLFLNRRGYAGFVSCRMCGTVVKCPHCDVSLTEHNNRKLMCHYCGYEQEKPKNCPSCGSKYIAAFGIGTQKVEEYAKKEFPNAKILRMDGDTTSKKGAYEQILQQFENQQGDILIGTQMVVKGHDFKNVGLVGAIAADLSLYANDFRSAERTFQLLCQAAGRAGRREEQGEMIIQTYQPKHYSIELAKQQDYQAFYEKELMYRSLLDYPPLGHILAIVLVGNHEKKIEMASKLLGAAAQEKKGDGSVMGPANAYIYRMNDMYRKLIYIKQKEKTEIVNIKNFLEGYVRYSDYFKGVSVYFDMDPMQGY